MNIERIYRMVAEGGLSKEAAISMIRELDKTRPGAGPLSQPAAGAAPRSTPEIEPPRAGPLRRALSDPGSCSAPFTGRPAEAGRPRISLTSPAVAAPPSPARLAWIASVVDLEPGILGLRLNPDHKSGFDTGLAAAIVECLAKVNSRQDAKVLVVPAAGGMFAGGGVNESGASALRDCLTAVRESQVPVIAAIQDDARDSGWLLAAACDLLVCGDTARLGFSSEASLPMLTRAHGDFLRQRFGAGLAAKMLASPDALTGADLARHGVFAPSSEAVERSAMDLAREISQFPRESLSLLKNHLAGDFQETAPKNAGVENPRTDRGDVDFQELFKVQDQAAAPGVKPPFEATAREVPFDSKVVRLAAYPDGVLVATMCDRSTKNAFSTSLAGGIQQLFDHIRTHSEYKALVLTGYDQYFASGGTKEGLLSIHQGTVRYSDAPLYELPLTCAIPVIAAMQGHAIGAGWAFAAFCDHGVLSEDGVYSSRFMRYGFTPGFGSTLIFERRFGRDLGREILFAARDYSGEDLWWRSVPMPVVPAAEVLPRAIRVAHGLAALPRETLAAAKKRANRPVVTRLAAVIEAELAMHDRTFVGNQATVERIQLHFDNAQEKIDQPSNPPAHEAPDSSQDSPPSLRQALRESLAEELRLSAGEIEDDTPFTDLGLDSITGVTWVRRVNKQFGLTITATQVYQAPTLGLFAGLVARELQSVRLDEPPPPAAPTPPAPAARTNHPPTRYPLSEGQKGLWLLQKLDPGMAAYNVPVPFLIKEETWARAVDSALMALLELHPILETVIATDEKGFPFQFVPSERRIRVTNESLPGLGGRAALDRLQSVFKEPFTLSDEPLMRVRLFTESPSRHVLLITIHHIIFDGTSLALFVRDFMALWANAVAGPAPAGAKSAKPLFFDFAEWERNFLGGAAAARELDYWRQKLSAPPPPLELPSDRVRPASPTHAGATVSMRLPATLSAALRALARQRRVSLFTLLLAIYKTLLRRYTGKETIVVGVPVAGRPAEEFERAIGYFVNMVAVRSSAGGQVTFASYLHGLKGAVIEALDHSRYPFRKLVSDLRVEPSPTHAPVFQTVFVLQNFMPQGGLEAVSAPSGGVELMPDLHQEGEYDLRFEVVEGSEQFSASVSFNSDLFDGQTMRRLLGHYTALASAVAVDSERPLDSYIFLPDNERELMERQWNDTRRPYPQDALIHEIFEARTARRPEATAVVSRARSMSLGELDRRAGSLAAYLQSLGVQPEDRVALCLQRSFEMMTGILGVLKAGAAYVPIDPGYPPDRAGFILGDCGAKIILTDSASADRLPPPEPHAIRRIQLDADRDLIEQTAMALPAVARRAAPSNLAYVIYTSGSTGQPKGVMVEHRQILNTLRHLQECYPVCEEDTYLLKTNYTFDVSISELFGWFMGQGRLAVLPPGDERFPDRIAEAMREFQVTHVNFVPPALGMFLHALGGPGDSRRPESLKYLMVAGEAFPRAMVGAAVRAFPNARIENIYGPTETSIYASAFSCANSGFSCPNTPIGKPIANTQLYVLDQARRSAGIGVPGELCVGGDSVARGYLNQPELTRERFIPNPFNPGSRLYLTGDLVRWLPDGHIEYFGRIDQQIKIRGFRVEPGEIEAVLNQHPGVKESVVVAVDNHGSKRLVAFFVPKPDMALDPAALGRHLGSRLPDYMVPAFFSSIDAIPTTSSGKVDRRALAARTFVSPENPERVAPQGDVEARLSQIWKELLNLPSVGATDRFFEAGGDSLLAVLLADRISHEFDCAFSAAALFKHPTIRAIAEEICPARAATSAETATRPAVHPPKAIETPDCEPGRDTPAYYADSMAIIGISCRFPGANNLDQFWSLLRDGRAGGKLLSRVELIERGVPESLIRDPKYVPLSLSIDEKEMFDSEFFNLSARNALLMDPQFRLLLAHSWQAVEDAGYDPGTIPDTSVFMSAGNGFYQMMLDRAGVVEPTDAYSSWVMSQGGTIPAMISFSLGFTGPSLFVHSNCSSSLAGLHLACQSLRSGESKYAVVGGATVFYPSRDGYLHRPGLNFSSDGRCKTFDASADGMTGGEGVAVIVLKRAVDAAADGDAIYAIVRGVAMNNDGPDKAGFYSPGARGQAAVIDKVLRTTGVDPESISYVEAHGTGTRLGDPVEIMALTDAYRRHTPRAGFCGIGSVKSNIGHSDTAAGLAGCIKLALSLNHRELPPSIHFETPNPAIDFENSPFFVVNHRRQWERQSTPLRGALSSFGVGGSNVHAILEEFIRRPDAESATGVPDTDGPYLIPLSAKNPGRLQEMIVNLRGHLHKHPAIRLADVARTLWVGRSQMEARGVFLTRDRAELLEQLDEAASGKTTGGNFWIGTAGKTEERDFLSQEDAQALALKWRGEGRLDKTAKLWVHGFPLDGASLPGLSRGRRIHLPVYPFAKERHSLDFRPRDGGSDPAPEKNGHPLLQRSQSLPDAHRFSTRLSGQEFFLADHLVAGVKLLPAVAFLEMARAAVAKITADRPAFSIRLNDLVWLRPLHVDSEPRDIHIKLQPRSAERVDFVVYSGSTEDETAAHFRGSAILESNRRQEALDLPGLQLALKESRIPGEECYDIFAGAGFQYGPGFTALNEVSFGGEAALARWALPSILAGTLDDYLLHPSLMDAALQGCALLALKGDSTPSNTSVSAPKPGLPFTLQSLTTLGSCPCSGWSWIRPSAGSRSDDRVRKLDVDICDDHGNIVVQIRGYAARPAAAPDSAGSPNALLHYRPVWTAAATPQTQASPPTTAKRIVVTCGVVDLSLPNAECHRIPPPPDWDTPGEWLVESCGEVFKIVQAAVSNARHDAVLVQLVVPSTGPAALLGATAGLFRCARLENPRFAGQVIETPEADPVQALIDKLEEDARAPGETHIRHTGRERFVPGWVETATDGIPAAFAWRDGGVYLITGGAGGVGRIFAREIINQTKRATVILVGRSKITEAQIAAWGLPAERVIYRPVDIARAEEVDAALRQIQATHGGVHGIIHAAGVVRDGFILKKSLMEFKSVLGPKILGTLLLERASRELNPDFIALFSSGVAWFGNPGQSDYATANAFMDVFARDRHQRAGSPRIVSIAWPLWDQGGMRVSEAVRSALKGLGIAPLTGAQGTLAFRAAVASGHAQWLTLPGDPNLLRRLIEPGPIPPRGSQGPAPSAAAPIQGLVATYVRRIISEVSKRPVEKIGPDTPFEKYGLDSILQVTVIEKLQEAVGELAKTLLFEHPTLGELVGYLLREHAESLRAHLAGQAGEDRAIPVSALAAVSVEAMPAATPSVEITQKGDHPQDVAIIGVSGRYPMSASLAELWEHLKAGRNCVTGANGRLSHPESSHSTGSGSGNGHSEFHGGFLDAIDRFDHSLFHIPAERVNRISPEARLFLEIAWETFEDAGYSRPRLQACQKRAELGVGVFAGSMYDQHALTFPSLEEAALGSNASEWHIPNRVSHFFDLTGPSVAVNSACSSSLLAIHLACESLRQKNCCMALAGGVNLTLHPSKYTFLKAANVLGSGTASRSFGAGDGYIPGEGVGAVLLKPLALALRDGDRIHGVIKSSFANHAGGRQMYTVPDPNQQAGLIAECLRRSGVSAESIGCVESAANGSPLGDPIEVLALQKAFARFTQREQYCALGSVKSNVGHLEAASGASQVAKVLLQLRHRTLVPSINATPRNPSISLLNSPFFIQEECAGWPAMRDDLTGLEIPRRALIVSVGAGGTGVSLVVEEHTPPLTPPAKTGSGSTPELLLLSAQTESSLFDFAARLSRCLRSRSEICIEDLARSLALRNPLSGRRAAIIAASIHEAIEKLERLASTRSGNETLGIHLSAGACPDEEATAMAWNQADPASMAVHWLRGSAIDADLATRVGPSRIFDLPNYAFDHARQFDPRREENHPRANNTPPDLRKSPRSAPLDGVDSQRTVPEPSQAVYRHNEPFLRDHRVGGKQILVGVAHASLAINAFFKWFPCERAVLLRQLTFIQPVEVRPGEEAGIQVASASASMPMEIKVTFRTSSQPDWRLTATGHVERMQPGAGRQDIESLQSALTPFPNLPSLYDSGEPHFHVGPSFRVIQSLYHGNGVALAEISLEENANTSGQTYALHPLLSYSAFTALLPLLDQAGFRWAFLPFAIESLAFTKTEKLSRCWVVVRVVRSNEEILVFDADVLTPQGGEVARYRGCSIRRLHGDTAAGPPLETIGPHSKVAPEDGDEWQFFSIGPDAPTLTAPASLDPEAKAGLIVRQSAARQLSCPIGQIDPRRSFLELPFGSLGLVEVIQSVGRVLGETLSPTLAFEHPTLTEFSTRLARDFPAILNRITVSRRQSREENPAGLALMDEPCPLSEGQKGLWALQNVFPEMGAYNCPLCFRVRQPLDAGRFQEACRFVLQQHPLLAAVVGEQDGNPVFQPRPPERFILIQIDATRWSDHEVGEWTRRAAKAPFDLEAGPLLRGTLLALSSGQTVVLFAIHHVVFDGSSYPQFIKTLMDGYHQLGLGRKLKIIPPRAGYRDYVLAEQSRLSGAEGSRRLSFWRRQLAGNLTSLELPADLPRSGSESFAGATVSISLPAGLAARLRALAGGHALYLSTVFLAGFKELLCLYSGQTDIIVGMPVNERSEPRFLPLIGYFINMIPIRSESVGGRAFLDFAREIQQTVLAGLSHRLPLPLLVRDLKLSGRGQSPLFQTAFEFQNFLRPEEAGAVRESIERALPIEWVEGLHQEGEYELALEVVEEDETCRLNLKYNPTLLREATVSRMAGHLMILLESAVVSPQRTLSTSLLLPESERDTLLHVWNNTRRGYPENRGVHELFEEQARRTPDAVAIVFRNQSLTYRELDARSASLALHLESMGVRPDGIVGLCVERSVEMIVGIYGILKAGGAYLPLDPDYPDERLRFMVGDSKTKWILTQSHLAAKVSAINGTGAVVVPLDAGKGPPHHRSNGKSAPHLQSGPRNLAYVLYTSGSTGVPKGVMVEHRALCNRIVWMQREYPLDATDRVLQKTPFSFDVSGWEFHWPLMAGAVIVVAEPGRHKDPEYLSGIIQAQSITTLHFVPSMLQIFLALAPAWPGPGPRRVFCSGEELTIDQVRRFFERFPATELHNLYGPTEAAIDVSYWRCRPDSTRIPIGRPVSNVQLHVVDAEMRLLPAGFAGELCIGGDALARGYLNRPELTREKFVENPFQSGAKLYRTGDLARWTLEGEIEYLGRLDHQVKIRGCRVELGEIESALRGIDGILDAVVVARKDPEDQKLVAYYVEGGVPGTLESLRARLRQKLPEHMVPSLFVAVDKIPLTSSGKADRKALSQPKPAAPIAGSNGRSSTETEARISALWCEVLSLDRVGPTEDFFDLGGHSLSALALVAKINAAFQTRLPLATLFEARSVANLAARLDSAASVPQNPYLAALQARGARPPLYLVPGIGGGSRGFLPLSRALGEDQPLFILQFPGLQGEREPMRTIEELAEFHVSELLKQPSSGGYRLGGWSMGGLVAFEMACQMARRGLAVDQLVLIDTYLQAHLEEFARLGGLARQSKRKPKPKEPKELRHENGDSVVHARRVLAANRVACAGYHPAQAYGGRVLYFYASQNAGSSLVKNGRGLDQGLAGRLKRGTRELWRRFLPRIDEHFISVTGSHDSLLEEPAAGILAREISASCPPQSVSV